jgi:hypothetical protein
MAFQVSGESNCSEHQEIRMTGCPAQESGTAEEVE